MQHQMSMLQQSLINSLNNKKQGDQEGISYYEQPAT
jgi:hypothetical protein